MLNLYLEDQAGDVLKKFRYGRKLSLKVTADGAKISPDQLRSFESGEIPPQADDLIRLGTVLGFDGEAMASLHLHPTPPPGVRLSPRVRPVDMSYGGYAVRCSLILHPDNPKRALLVDTGGGESLTRRLESEKIVLEGILLTHGHDDHGGGWTSLRSAGMPGEDLPVLLSREDRPLLESQGSGNDTFMDPEEGCRLLKKTGWEVKVIPTPGHTKGSVAYLANGTLFVGDTLFCGSAGRAWTPEDFPEQLRSIRHLLSGLPDEIILIPGHGPLTTVGYERTVNPFIRTMDPLIS
ncbi:MAG: MBL fold metallo-hydrolase [Leptospirillia bacterium]